jgi:hypothetical protein
MPLIVSQFFEFAMPPYPVEEVGVQTPKIATENGPVSNGFHAN